MSGGDWSPPEPPARKTSVLPRRALSPGIEIPQPDRRRYPFQGAEEESEEDSHFAMSENHSRMQKRSPRKTIKQRDRPEPVPCLPVGVGALYRARDTRRCGVGKFGGKGWQRGLIDLRHDLSEKPPFLKGERGNLLSNQLLFQEIPLFPPLKRGRSAAAGGEGASKG